MGDNSDQIFNRHLQKRSELGILRFLSLPGKGVDLYSNDYLGFSRDPELQMRIREKITNTPSLCFGGTGSRLISGNSSFYEGLEQKVASFHRAEASLIHSSGYAAGMGLVASLAGRKDTLIHDELVHASLRDGVQLSYARSFSFRHNSMEDLIVKLEKAQGHVFVIVESLYSMDGDRAPLKELVELKDKYDFHLVVDEAHAIGTIGMGKGLVVEEGLEEQVTARVVTFGKALGSHGAAVLGSKVLKEYGVNFFRPFIYSTALPVPDLMVIDQCYDFLSENFHRIEELKEGIDRFCQLAESTFAADSFTPQKGPIQSLIIPGNQEVKKVAEGIREAGFEVKPILSPTVPKEKERIRFCIHWHNTPTELENVIIATSSLMKPN